MSERVREARRGDVPSAEAHLAQRSEREVTRGGVTLRGEREATREAMARGDPRAEERSRDRALEPNDHHADRLTLSVHLAHLAHPISLNLTLLCCGLRSDPTQ